MTGAGAPGAVALSLRRIATSTTGLAGPTAATRQPSGWRPVQVSGVLSRPGETHSPGTYVVSGDLCRGHAGWASVHPASARHSTRRAAHDARHSRRARETPARGRLAKVRVRPDR